MTSRLSVFERFLHRIKSHKAVALILGIGSAIIALASFTDAAKNLISLFDRGPSPEAARTTLAGLSVPFTQEAFVKSASDGDETATKLFIAAEIPIDEPAFLEARTERLTALAAAAFENHLEVVTLLLKAGAKVVTPNYNALVAGALSDRVEILQRMLNQDVGLAAKEEAFVLAERRDMLETLARAGVDVKKVGTSAMLQATSAETVDYLVDHGISVNVKDNSGESALQHLMDDPYMTSAEAVLAMLKHGADIESRDQDGATLLLRAAKNGNVDMAQALLERKASVSVRNGDGRTPLSLAADSAGPRGKKIIEMLIEHGADVNAADKDGKTALHYAVLRRERATVELLLAKGAKKDIPDSQGNTPLALAEKNDRGDMEPIIAMLRDGTR